MREIIYMDTETKLSPLGPNEQIHILYFGYAEFKDYDRKNKEDSCIFFSVPSYWDWVESHCKPNRTLYIFAHNQDFDFRIVRGFHELKARGWEVTKDIIDNGRFILSVRKKRTLEDQIGKDSRARRVDQYYYITFLDTTNWFKESLEKLGERIGFPKLPFPDWEAPFEVWLPYCQRDVKVTRRVVEIYREFLKTHDMGNLGETIAKQAFNAYRHRFMKYPIEIHTDPYAIEIERSSYYGGRTECFFIGKEAKGPYYKLDINSMYPAVMRDYDYPCRFRMIKADLDPDMRTYHEKHSLYIADCTVTTNQPLVPYHYHDRLCFPIGTFSTTLCQPEIDLLLSRGQEVVIHRAAYYEKAPLFREWVDYMYPLRKRLEEEGRPEYAYFVKILMNSLYGKFGQRNMQWIQCQTLEEPETWYRTFFDEKTGKDISYKAVAGTVYRQEGLQEGWDTFTAIASFVTSYARVYLYTLMEQAGLDNCYYCDTDSIITNAAGFARLKDLCEEKTLGLLKIEGVDQQIEIYNLKDYVFDGKTYIKGIPKRAKQVSSDTWECEQWEHLSGSIHKGRVDSVVIKTVFKTLKREYNKGRVLSSGRVSPYVVNEPGLFNR